jgi:oligoendopeptidase F
MNFRCFTSAGQEQPEKFKDEPKSRYKHAKRGERESTTKSSAAAIIELITKISLKCKQTNKYRELDHDEKLKNAKWQVMCSPHSK